MRIKNKYRGTEISIFSEMSTHATRCGAVNLSQGFPDYEIDDNLTQLLNRAAKSGYNQYAPMMGNPLLIDNIIEFNKNRIVPIHCSKEEITVVPGATYGIYTALATILEMGDEVILLEPCYDSYSPAIELNGGVPIYVPLNNHFRIDWEKLDAAISHKTKAIIVNYPHNPSGVVWSKEDMDLLAKKIEHTEIIVISDEVYDVLTYDDNLFRSVFSHPKLRNRCFCIFSFGKMFHITGWKLGYVLACDELMYAFRRNHQFISFSVNAPAQYALAKYLEVFSPIENRKLMQSRRDYFLNAMANTPFQFRNVAEGGYFQLASFSEIQPQMSDKDFAIWLTENHKVATIPISAFYHQQNDTGLVRFCFAKKEETINKAAQNLLGIF